MPNDDELGRSLPWELRVEVYSHDVADEFPCIVCGDLHQQNFAAAVLYDGGLELGDICPQCVAAGATGAAQRGREYAERLRAQAQARDALAAALPEIEHWPNPIDVRLAELEAGPDESDRSGFDDDLESPD